MTPTVTSQCFGFFKVSINGTLHLSIKMDELVGVQSWKFKDSKHTIEFTTKTGSIIAEYDSENLWKEVLTHVNKHIN